jgi:insertion element IS1 protein InsB
VASAEDHIISDEEHTVVEHLLREHISRRGICRAVGGSLTWLFPFIVERFASCPDHLHVHLSVNPTDVVIQRLDAETDEMWSFVGKKVNKQWSWLAMDTKTRQVMAFHIGDRSRESGAQLWAKIPGVYQQQATFYIDLYEVYKGVIPPTQHKAITKHARKTNHVEFQQHPETTPFSFGARHAVTLQETGEPHRCYQVLHLPL